LNKVRYAMLIDLNRCIGCYSCQVACKMENGVPLGSWRSWVKQIEKGKYPNVSKSFLPLLCNNCENPICVTVCPVLASIKRDDGIVFVDPHRCIGCRYCMASCPYGVRYVNPLLNIVQKCDFCLHRVDQGLQPACVEACPAQARIFGDLHDPESEIAKLIAGSSVARVKPDMGTDPKVYYIGLDEEAVEKVEREE